MLGSSPILSSSRPSIFASCPTLSIVHFYWSWSHAAWVITTTLSTIYLECKATYSWWKRGNRMRNCGIYTEQVQRNPQRAKGNQQVNSRDGVAEASESALEEADIHQSYLGAGEHRKRWLSDKRHMVPSFTSTTWSFYALFDSTPQPQLIDYSWWTVPRHVLLIAITCTFAQRWPCHVP